MAEYLLSPNGPGRCNMPHMSQAAGLTHLGVRGLFGHRDLDIDMAVEAPTILTGANGTGKSTLLRLVNAVSSGNVRMMASLPVKSFELDFEHMPSFEFSRREPGGTISISWGGNHAEIPISRLNNDFPSELAVWTRGLIEDSEILHFNETLLNESRIGVGNFDYGRRMREELLRRRAGLGIESFERPDWILELTEAFPVLFVTDQRLIVDHEKGTHADPTGQERSVSRRLAVEAASASIASQMIQADQNYARASQSQDRTFPIEVIKAMTDRSMRRRSNRRLIDLLAEVDGRRQALRSVGLTRNVRGY